MGRLENTKAHVGKTKRDHISGAWARREKNNQARAAWCNRDRAKSPDLRDFPFSVCNGKKGKRWKKWLKLS